MKNLVSAKKLKTVVLFNWNIHIQLLNREPTLVLINLYSFSIRHFYFKILINFIFCKYKMIKETNNIRKSPGNIQGRKFLLYLI